jgi:hypothetical protein
MTRPATLSLLAIVTAFMLAPELQAQEKKGKEKKAKVETQQHVGFSTVERQIIIDFFVKHPHQVQSLPPGIAKNLARGKPLPPGIAKKHIPADLKARLPARVGVEITIFGDRIVLLEASGLVVDVLDGVFG